MAIGDIDTVRFTLEIDPNDATKQDSVVQITLAALFPVATYAIPPEIKILDVMAGSGGGTTRKIQCIAFGRKSA